MSGYTSPPPFGEANSEGEEDGVSENTVKAEPKWIWICDQGCGPISDEEEKRGLCGVCGSGIDLVDENEFEEDDLEPCFGCGNYIFCDCEGGRL